MAKPADVGKITKDVYDLVSPLEDGDRQRVLTAVHALFGEKEASTPDVAGRGSDSSPETGQISAHSFFASKDPQSKIEDLAVAAAYREKVQKRHEHAKADFRSVIEAARRNFDAGNYTRDLGNAKAKGLLIKGPTNKLSYYGQQYVDALPDRTKVKALRRPKRAGTKKPKKTPRTN